MGNSNRSFSLVGDVRYICVAHAYPGVRLQGVVTATHRLGQRSLMQFWKVQSPSLKRPAVLVKSTPWVTLRNDVE